MSNSERFKGRIREVRSSIAKHEKLIENLEARLEELQLSCEHNWDRKDIDTKECCYCGRRSNVGRDST